MPRKMMMTIASGSIGLGPLPFNLHIQDSTGRMVLYGRKGVVITAELKESIDRNNRIFYITHDDVDSYLDYTLDNIENVVSKKRISPKIKTTILKDAGRKIFSKIQDEQLTPKTIEHSEKFTRSVVDLILGSPEAYLSLLSLSKESSYLFDHSLNTCTFCVLVGIDLYGNDEVKLFILGLGGLLMDIGMSYIDRDILGKDGKLSQEEWDIVKSHTDRGFEILKEYELPIEVIEMVHYHHERMDGSGYPEGLQGDEIPEHVQIASVCDVYDALTSDRTYRKEHKHIAAINAMLNERQKYSQTVLESLMRVVIQNQDIISAMLARQVQ